MRSLELFSGAGGLALGLGAAGFRHDLMVEWDEAACRTIEHNKKNKIRPVRDWPLVKADARGMDYARFSGKIDLVAGGPPCQPFSIAGKHKGDTDHRDMWPVAVRAVREIRPRAFLFENVRGLLRPAFASYLRHIELSLSYPEIAQRDDEAWRAHLARLEKVAKGRGKSDLFYNVQIHPVDAADFGAAQNRKRVIFVGIRGDLAEEFVFPKATHSREALALDQSEKGEYWDRHRVSKKEREICPSPVVLVSPRTKPWRTVRDALNGLPDPTSRKNYFPNHRFQPGARSYIGHTGSPLDQPAKALKAGDHGVPGGENMLRRPDGSVRYFTVREAARLQAFPDNFVFPDDVPWSEAMRQLGNAVPVELASTVARTVVETIGPRTSKLAA